MQGTLRSLRILHVGATDITNGMSGEKYLVDAWRASGHAVDYLDGSRRNRLAPRIAAADDFDAFFLQRGAWFPLPLVRVVTRPKIFWDTELPDSLPDRLHLIRSGLFDRILFWSKGIMNHVIDKGWAEPSRCGVFIGGFDHRLHRPIEESIKDIDVLFVGAHTARRERIIADASKHLRLVFQSAFGEDMTRLYSRAKIILNVHASGTATTEARVFEVLGCRGFLLSERLSEENPFDSRHLVEFKTVKELVDKARYYLAHPVEREQIAAEGHRAALAGHTYQHRADELARLMTQLCGEDHATKRPPVKIDLGFRAYGAYELARWTFHRVRRLGQAIR